MKEKEKTKKKKKYGTFKTGISPSFKFLAALPVQGTHREGTALMIAGALKQVYSLNTGAI